MKSAAESPWAGVRVGGLGYRNAWPLQRGLPGLRVRGTPAETARAFAARELDLALLPVGAIVVEGWEKNVVPGSVIAADGPAYSVYVTWPRGTAASTWPIYRDPASRSSNLLYEILRREVGWFGERFAPLQDGPLPPECGRVLIGDAAVAFRRGNTDHEFLDLAAVWKEAMGLPFVFAQWVSRQEASGAWAEALADLRERNLEEMDEWTAAWPEADFWRWYLRGLHYRGGPAEEEAVRRFAELVRGLSSQGKTKPLSGGR